MKNKHLAILALICIPIIIFSEKLFAAALGVFVLSVSLLLWDALMQIYLLVEKTFKKSRK
jgi:hypothetical protein